MAEVVLPLPEGPVSATIGRLLERMDNFFLPLDQRPKEAADWESPYCVNVDLLVSCISKLLDGKEADIPWYDFKSGNTGGYKKMQGEKDCIVIAEGIHMLNPLIFD